MPINRDKVDLWKQDVAQSVDMYNSWFLEFAPLTFRETRITATATVEAALRASNGLRDLRPDLLIERPEVLSVLRMSTCPPIAVDRLIGLSGTKSSLVKAMESGRLPRNTDAVADDLTKITDIINLMVDPDVFPWLPTGADPTEAELHRSATIVADRLCGSQANPIIRNEQERRQLSKLKAWLTAKNYTEVVPGEHASMQEMPNGTYSFRLNIKVNRGDDKTVNIPVDAVIKRANAVEGEYPILIEAKSAGDFTNTNKRRKEEAQKANQLRETYGDSVQFLLFLCGYFDTGYLGYEAAEGIDWIWEHRMSDLEQLNL